MSGLYTHQYRHAATCSFCKLGDRGEQKDKCEKVRETMAALKALTTAQEPYASWSQVAGQIHEHTGVSDETFDLVVRSCREQLIALHGHKTQQAGRLLLTPENQTLLLLCFMRDSPTDKRLAEWFPGEKEYYAYENVKHIASVVAPVLVHYVKPPDHIRNIIQSGHLARAAFFTDSSDTKIPRPGRGQSYDRRLYYNGKYRHWGIKFQVSVGLDGRIWENSKAYPCSISDRQVFEESSLPALILSKNIRGVGDSHYVKCEGMYGKKLGSKQSIEFEDYNQTIENVRAIIENANARLKIWKVLGGTWLHDRRDLGFFGQLVTIACGLLNLEIMHGHPLRVNLQTLLPRVANPRHAKKLKKVEEKLAATEESSSEEEESEEGVEDEDVGQYHEIDRIKSHRKGRAKGKDVIFYRVKFLDGPDRECTEDFITAEALVEYRQHHHV
jgi:hypothetical protein